MLTNSNFGKARKTENLKRRNKQDQKILSKRQSKIFCYIFLTMSGIPTPRPSKLAAPGSIARSTTSAISRTAAAPAIAPKKGLKRLNGEEKASDAAIKRARTAMGAPTVGAAKKPVSSSSLASAARKPLATRNTIGSRSNSGSSLNERRMTVAGTQPTTEKPRAAGKGKCKCDQNSM